MGNFAYYSIVVVVVAVVVLSANQFSVSIKKKSARIRRLAGRKLAIRVPRFAQGEVVAGIIIIVLPPPPPPPLLC